jgi:hypothetical protein
MNSQRTTTGKKAELKDKNPLIIFFIHDIG